MSKEKKEGFRRLDRVTIHYVENKEGKRLTEKVQYLKPQAKDALEQFFAVYKNEKRTFTPEGALELKITPEKTKLLGLFEEPTIIIPQLPIERFKLQSVLILGPRPDLGYHFSENLFKELQKQGILVQYIHDAMIPEKDLIPYNKHEKIYPLSLVLKKLSLFQPDLIVIDEATFIYENDVNIPVFYHQREFKRDPKCVYPDILLMWRQGFIDYWASYSHTNYIRNVKHLETIPLFVDIDTFKPLEKRPLLGITGIGNREAWKPETLEELKDLGELASFKIAIAEEEEFRALGFRYYAPPINDKQYREIMPQCECVWIPNTTGQFLSHRMFECMASNVICVIKLEGNNHETELKNLGFEKGIHYIGVKEFSEIKILLEKLTDKQKADMISKAFKLVSERYSNKQLVEFIENLYNKYEYNRERFDVICPLYWVDDDLLNNNTNNWFKEIPIRKLFIGVNNPNAKIVCNHPQVELIDQTGFKTLGRCLRDLMERVKTNWFVYLHADAEIMENMFKTMRMFMEPNVGIIESERVEWDGTFHNTNVQKIPKISPYGSYYFRDRAFSGFQLFQKKAIEKFLPKIEDDFIYRMEDVVFQNNVEQAGFRYKKTFCMHVHQTKQKKWTFSEEETNAMSWKALIKYTNPTSLKVCFPAMSTIRTVCFEKHEQNLSQLMFYCFQNNPNWGEIIRDHWLLWENNEKGEYD